LIIPIANIAVLIAPIIAINTKVENRKDYEKIEPEMYLARDVMDRQIIDTNGIRVVRVNDLELVRINDKFYVANVDISGAGLLRRLGLGKLPRKFSKNIRTPHRSNIISWDDVELLPADGIVRLKVSSERIADLHPADLAEILTDLSRTESTKLIESLDVKTLADTLEEVEPDFQVSLVQDMPNERVADVLEEMSPDEAADLLAELPEKRSQELLSLMEDEEAEDVKKLLAYPEDSAGGIMTTEFCAIRPDISAEQLMKYLRANAEEAETIYYVYVTDNEDHLNGVFSLRDLVLAEPETPVTQFMHHRVVSVNVNDSQDDVAQAIAKYNLLAIPVVDDDKKLLGIVTADDALDKIIPTAWKKRLPRLYF
jgi:magnesium transporter